MPSLSDRLRIRPALRRVAKWPTPVIALAVAQRVARGLFLTPAWNRLVGWQLKRSGLFDRAFYMRRYKDADASELHVLQHYLSAGANQGYQPNAAFDPAFYSAQLKRWWDREIDPVLHFDLFGWRRGLSPHPLFDTRFYLESNRDVRRANVNPLSHFLRGGWAEGRNPSADFDSRFYLKGDDELRKLEINPLVHFIETGAREGRRTRAQDGEDSSRLWQPNADDWNALRPRLNAGAPEVDVVVPVYGQALFTLRCLYKVLTAPVQTAFDLVVIDDASPDEALSQILRGFAERGLITLVTNKQNQGFVRSANIGFAHNATRDVVLLNSDAEVENDWLDRLRRAAYSATKIGTVTPFANNATICSYPVFAQDNPAELELSTAALDQMAARTNAGKTADLPTAVGFCMYVRRDCLAETGLFDEAAFGTGYGEENDFCLRAEAKGWRHVLAADVYVRHWGGLSFKDQKSGRVRAALELLRERHPAYLPRVQAFIAADPIRPLRETLDKARLARLGGGNASLFISHRRGGGSEQRVREEIAELAERGIGHVRLQPAPWPRGHVELRHGDVGWFPNLPSFDLAKDRPALVALLRDIGIGEIRVHHLIDLDRRAPDWIADIARMLDVPLRFVVHDYFPICPRVNLIDDSGLYCGEPDAAGCRQCLRSTALPFRRPNIEEWRGRYHRLFAASSEVVTPDADAAERLSRYFPDVSFAIRPHEDDAPSPLVAPTIEADEPLRIAVIGAIGPIKGIEVLRAMARDARDRSLPLSFHIVGYSTDDKALRALGVSIGGAYPSHRGLEVLLAARPHIVWLPSVWPETYSYTLSLALSAGLPVAAFDIGAIAARLRRVGLADNLMPFDLAKSPVRINDAFVQYRAAHVARGKQAAVEMLRAALAPAV